MCSELVDEGRPDLFALNCELEGLTQELSLFGNCDFGIELSDTQITQIFFTFAEHLRRIIRDIEYIDANYKLVKESAEGIEMSEIRTSETIES